MQKIILLSFVYIYIFLICQGRNFSHFSLTVRSFVFWWFFNCFRRFRRGFHRLCYHGRSPQSNFSTCRNVGNLFSIFRRVGKWLYRVNLHRRRRRSDSDLGRRQSPLTAVIDIIHSYKDGFILCSLLLSKL